MSARRFIWAIGAMLLSALMVVAQGAACPDLIYEALSRVNEVCTATQRNELCYGNFNIEVSGETGAELDFDEPGDIVSLEDVEEIHTSPLNIQSEEFGVALLRAQADLPNSIPGQNVTFLLMGDVTMIDNSDAVEGAAPLQAFIFQPGVGDSTCEGIDYNTLVIDSPDNTVVSLNINGIDVDLGSTAVVIDKPDNKIDILIVEGQGLVTSQGETVTVDAGNWTQIQMGGETGFEAVGTPEEPVPFPPRRIAHIPFDLLFGGQNVALNRPVTADAELAEHPATNVIDGDISIGWNPGTVAPYSIEIDLENETNVAEIRAITSQSETDTTTHRILVADSSREFFEVHVFEGATEDEQLLSFVPDAPIPNVRYVKIETVSAAHATGWREIEVIAAGYAGCTVESIGTINLRATPSTSAEAPGTLEPGNLRIVSGQTVGSDGVVWWRLHGAVWVRSDVVTASGGCEGVPTIELE
jgi:hypothetical protein